MAYILIVDDEPSIRELLADLFGGAGFEIGLAESGVQATRSVAARCPDLVLTDILMPDKDGIETIVELRRTQPGLPIIAMSGGSHRAQVDLLSMASRLGVVGIYRKPFDPFALLADVQSLLASA